MLKFNMGSSVDGGMTTVPEIRIDQDASGAQNNESVVDSPDLATGVTEGSVSNPTQVTSSDDVTDASVAMRAAGHDKNSLQPLVIF